MKLDEQPFAIQDRLGVSKDTGSKFSSSQSRSSKKVIRWGPMHEEWREIIEFPGYLVSDTGNVQNNETGRMMAKLVNQRGIVNVGLMRRGIQYKRSVSVLVADAFVKTARSLEFDTPINLNGNRTDNRAENLIWRPRWFAIRFFQQFGHTALWHINNPIQDVKSEEVFENSWDAVTKYGLLHREIAISISSKTYVWPTYQRFRILR